MAFAYNCINFPVSDTGFIIDNLWSLFDTDRVLNVPPSGLSIRSFVVGPIPKTQVLV